MTTLNRTTSFRLTGAESPQGQEGELDPDGVIGKGWFAALRLYGPLEPWFDKTWQPGEVELFE